MRWATVLALVTLTGCTTKGFVLEPPTGRGDQAVIASDMRKCGQEARTPREITSAERSALAGKPTARLFMNGRPVVTPEGKPALHLGAFSGDESTPFADRYALCLLGQGYTWRER